MNRRLVVGAVAAVLAAGPLLSAPAFAADPPPTTVTFHLVNPLGEPVQHVEVTGEPTDDADSSQPDVLFGVTNVHGDITASDGVFAGHRIGVTREFRLFFRDTTGGRDLAGTQYALASFVQPLKDGPNVLPTITVQLAGSIRGKALTPSGQTLQYPFARAKDPTSADGPYVTPPLQDLLDDEDDRDPKQFFVEGLVPGSYDLSIDTSATSTPTYTHVAGPVTIGDGQTKDLLIKDVRVSCSTSLAATSTRSGAVSLKARISGLRGISKPGGTVVLSRGGNRLKSFAWTGPTRTLSLTNQPRGKKVSYQLAYSGGDCFRTSVKTAVTVRR